MPAPLRRDVARARVGARGGRQALGISARRQHAVEIDIGMRGDEIALAMLADGQTVDLLEDARAVGIERLARALGRRERHGAVILPGAAVGLARHVGQREDPILRQELDLVDRLVAGGGAGFMEFAGGNDIAVGRPVKFGRVALERMGAELLDIDRDRRGEPLRAQEVEPGRAPVGIGLERQPVFRPRLVAGDERRAGGKRGVLRRRNIHLRRLHGPQSYCLLL